MASLIEELMDVLEKETDEYSKLIISSEKKTDYIIRGDIDNLHNVITEEQDMLDALNLLEKKREQLLDDMVIVMNRDREVLKLDYIINMLESQPQLQRRLSLAHDKLREVLGRMSQVNERNRMLIDDNLDMINFNLNLIKNNRIAPETANYDRDAYTAFNRRSAKGEAIAAFDTKQ